MHTTSITDFKKEKVLGTGSFGSVYLVRRRQDNKIYALKTVNLEKLNKREQENSVNEVRILASVNHPNVIGYKEAFWDDDKSSLNIVMEYADDGDLHSKIQKMKKEGGCFKEPIIWSYAIQMIEGLKALHDKKIMHRDLKSTNIFLVKDKHQCKIGDMNVSKVIKEKVLTTQTGTPYYASPEVWKDNPYSYKSDLWSIGCVIYELCALRPPFQGKDLDELYENVCKGEPERINKMYSDDLWKMILMLLQVDANKRVDCNQFLNHDLIKIKIEEIKKDSNIYIESFIYDKNKDRFDEYLLKTIKFNDIKEIKAQLPTKKNYNSNILSDNLKFKKNNNSIINKHKLNDQNKEDLLSKKLKEKQLQLEKMKNYLNKNNKSNNKIRKKKIINIKENNNENDSKNNKTVIYKRNSLRNSLAKNGERKSFLKDSHPEIDISHLNSGKKQKNLNISGREKKIFLSELYLKKNVNKISKQSNSFLDKDSCKTPMANYNKILKNKLMPSIIQQNENINNNSHKKIASNCFTNVDRKKNIKYIEEEEVESEEGNKPNNTIEANHNNYIYNKPNLIIKKQNSIKTDNKAQQRPKSAIPIYKRASKLSPSLYKSNLPISNSFGEEKMGNKHDNPKVINTPCINKNENIKENNSQFYPNKLDRYYSCGISIATPTNAKQKSNFIKNNTLSAKSQKQISNKQYMKKLNVKYYYQQKLKDVQNDNLFEKKANYGKIYEKERNEEKDKEKQKEKISGKKKININIGNSNKIKNRKCISKKSNAFLEHIKTINNRNEVDPVLNCYLSPKNNNSQVFNNFYSINVPVPFKVINVFKK